MQTNRMEVNAYKKAVVGLLTGMLFLLTGLCPVLGAESVQSRSLSGSAIAPNATLNLRDLVPQYKYSNYDYQYKVMLTYGRENQTDYAVGGATWTYAVTYTLDYYNWDGSSAGSSTPATLTISRDGANPTAAIYSAHQLHNGAPAAPFVKLTITNNPAVNAAHSDVRLELYQLNNSYSQLNTALLTAPAFNNTTRMLYWHYVKGAEYYELEWSFIDTKYENGAENASNITAQRAFEVKEPVRIQVNDQHYNQFNFTYPEGKVFFRVRAVGVFSGNTINSTVLTGPWEYTSPLVLAGDALTADLQKKNWAYSTSYAEEGKFKKIITYYDGTLRNRQSLTNLSSEGLVVASEPEYDYEGRPVVSGLAVPISDQYGTTLRYRAGLNTFANGKADYATDALKKTDPAVMSGASETYYSDANTIEAAPFRDWLAEAEGFAYTHTQYLQDGSGRPAMVALPGEAFMLKENTDAADPHYTRYYYSGVGSMELARLFGNNLGDEQHYRKTTIVDGNGQASVNYTDLAGNTVATSLIGATPANVNELAGIQPVTITDNLAGNNILNKKDLEMVSSKTYTNIGETDYHLKYSLTGSVMNSQFLASCQACRYDLEITVLDPEGNHVSPSPIKINDEDIVPATLSCPQASYTQNLLVDETLVFNKPGNYTITKKLKLNEDAMNALLSTLTGGPTLAEVTGEYLDEIDYSVCENDGQIPAGLLDNLGAAECESIDGQIRQQVAPGGKYYTKSGWLAAAWNDPGLAWGTKPSLTDLQDPRKYNQDWEDVLIHYHPEYCHSNMCHLLAPFRKFEKEMGMIDTWQAARAKGWVSDFATMSPLSPNSMGGFDFPYSSSTAPDPFFTNGTVNFPTSPTDEFFEFEVLMEETFKENNTFDFNHNGNTTETFDIYDLALTGYTFDATKAVTADQAWRNFRSTYLHYRNKLMTRAVENGWIAGAGACAYLDEEDAVVKAPGLSKPIEDYQAMVEAGQSMEANCAAACVQNVAIWMQQIEINCEDIVLTSTQQDQIEGHLEDLCNNHCGASNPNGLMLTEYYRDADFIAIEAILNPLGCSLLKIAFNNPYTYTCRQGLYANAWKIDDYPACTTFTNTHEYLIKHRSTSHKGDYVGTETDLTLTGTYPGLGVNNLVDLEGYIYAPLAGNYQFEFNTNARIHMVIDGNIYLSDWTLPNGFGTTCGSHVSPSTAPTVSLTAGYHKVIIHRAQGEGAPNYYFNLYWKKPGDANFGEIPAANLFTEIPPAEGSCDLVTGLEDCPYDLDQARDCEEDPLYYVSACTDKLMQAFNTMLQVDRSNTAVPNCPGGNTTWEQEKFYANPSNPEILQAFIDMNPACINNNYGGVYGDNSWSLGREEHEIAISNVPGQLNINAYDYGVKQFTLLRKNANVPYYAGDNCPWPAEHLSPSNTTAFYEIQFYKDQYNLAPIPYDNIVSIGKVFIDCDVALADPDPRKTRDNGVKVKLQVQNLNGYTGELDAYFREESFPFDPSFIQINNSANNGHPIFKYKYPVLPANVFCNQTFTWTPEEVVDECKEALETIAISEAYNEWVEQDNIFKNEFLAAYITNCLESTLSESFTGSYELREHHYTLFYYDQAGNLVQTVPPDGVRPLDNNQFDSDGKLIINQSNLAASTPAHLLTTNYTYNTLGQLLWQQTPDAGISQFFYDSKGRLRLSQNALQAHESVSSNKYSYARYDNLGRAVEVGQYTDHADPASWYTNVANKKLVLARLDDQVFPDPAACVLSQITQTVYDVAESGMLNTRGRVAAAISKSDETTQQSKTSYSYDIHGNVALVRQEITGLASKEVSYEYDLISSNVKKVYFQKGQGDMFVHRYRYDSDNRIVAAYTSLDDKTWEEDAHYFYYKHGPVARLEYGHDKVQAQDYYYTLQGWLKGVNVPGTRDLSGSVVRNTTDISSDGFGSGVNRFVAQDEFGFSLNYYQGDYKAIEATQAQQGLVHESNIYGTTSIAASLKNNEGLYSGNITSMVTGLYSLGHTPDLAATMPDPADRERYGLRASAFQYDQLDRLTHSYNYEYNAGWARCSTSAAINTCKYDASYTYDANGNIRIARVNGATDALIDDLEYGYLTDNGASSSTGKLTSHHQLQGIIDHAGDKGLGDVKAGVTYTYDKLGNLTSESNGGNGYTVQWNAYGKVSLVDLETPTAGGIDKIRFTYDAAGQRIKKEGLNGSGIVIRTDYYLRDANGATLMIQNGTTTFEYSIIAAGQIGTYTVNQADVALDRRVPDAKRYSMSNHLGNVLVTVSGIKLGYNTTGDARAEFYTATVRSISDYYPFGWTMPGRSYSDNYRYGFNGQEKDPEWGNYAFEYRIQDPRIGRFLSTDPDYKKYAGWSPYLFAGNNPVYYIDQQGRGIVPGLESWGKANGYTAGLMAGLLDSYAGAYVDAAKIYYRYLGYSTIIQGFGFWGYGVAYLAADAIGDAKAAADTYEGIKTLANDATARETALKNLRDALGQYAANALGENSAGEQGYAHGQALWAVVENAVGQGGFMKGLKFGFSATQAKAIQNAYVAKFGCFVEGTLIWIDDNNKDHFSTIDQDDPNFKKIEDIKVGDLVMAYDEITGKAEPKKVTYAYKRLVNGLIKVTAGNEVIYTTEEHPFYSNGRWIEAKFLKPGDPLHIGENEIAFIQNILNIDTLVTVYNFTVEDFHNYYVTSSKILVHNNSFVTAVNPSMLFAVIKNKWAHVMSAADMKEVSNTIKRIRLNDKSAYPGKDGTVFQNSHEISPDAQRLNTSETYTEWTVKTPGVGGRGRRRICVSNQTGKAYYSHDHYKDYVEIDLNAW